MRRDLIIGIVVSLAVHGGVAYFGDILAHQPKAVLPPDELPKIEVFEMPKIQPDEEETPDADQPTQPQDYAPPMQQDVPEMTTDTSFVQELQPPPPENVRMDSSASVIPTNIGRWAKGLGEIFDVSKLDQIPQATVQIQPNYPFEMRRAGISGQVVVDFIVDPQGNVHNAFATSSTQHEFEQPAVIAVSKWKFRPGRKGGRDVSTHMTVPINFNINNDD